jgi:hypothetical protein
VKNLPLAATQWQSDRTPEWHANMKALLEVQGEEKQEWILSCDASFINQYLGFRHGMNVGLSMEEFLKAGADALSYRRRKGLESNQDQRHLINYDWFFFMDEQDVLRCVRYARTKFSGEQKLVNGHSAGIGGHQEIQSLIISTEAAEDSVPDMEQTLRDGIMAERVEEIRLGHYEGYVIPTALHNDMLEASQFVGFLCDNEDPKRTGAYHIGLVSVVFLPRGVYARTRDASNQYVDAPTLDELLADPILERWSRIAGEYFAALPGGIKKYIEDHFVGIGKVAVEPA